MTQLTSSNTTNTIYSLSPSENTVTQLVSFITTDTINDTILSPSENTVTQLTSSNTTSTNSTINVISLVSLYNDSDGRGVYPRYNSLIEEIQAKFRNLQYMWRHFSPEQRAEYALNDNYNRDYHNINSDFNSFWRTAKHMWDDWLTINQRVVCRRTIYENDSPVWRIMNPRYNSLIELIKDKFAQLQNEWREFSPEQRDSYALNIRNNRDIYYVNSNFNCLWRSTKTIWERLTFEQQQVCRSSTIYENDCYENECPVGIIMSSA